MTENVDTVPLVQAAYLYTGVVAFILPCPHCEGLMTLVIDPKPNDAISLTTTRRRDEKVGRVKFVTLAALDVDHSCPALEVSP